MFRYSYADEKISKTIEDTRGVNVVIRRRQTISLPKIKQDKTTVHRKVKIEQPTKISARPGNDPNC